MKLKFKQLEEVIFGKTGFRRFTQDSSVLPDVWMDFGTGPDKQFDLLLTPVWGTAPGKISNVIDKRLEAERKTARWEALKNHRPQGTGTEMAYNTSTIAIRLYFDEMIRVVLPLTKWWENYILEDEEEYFSKVVNDAAFRANLITALKNSVEDPDKASAAASTTAGKQFWDINSAIKHDVWGPDKPKRIEHLIWLIKIVGAIILEDKAEKSKSKTKKSKDQSEKKDERLDDVEANVNDVFSLR